MGMEMGKQGKCVYFILLVLKFVPLCPFTITEERRELMRERHRRVNMNFLFTN